jgi:lipopolysaccharide biosynthesis glycosyltransferase
MIDIYIAIDNHYKNNWMHVYNSIKANTKEPIRFNIICESDVSISNDRPDINIIHVTPDIETIKKFNQKQTRSIYLRWMIPDLCKGNKAIYLDCDLVVTGDIKELWDVELGNYCLAAVKTYALRFDLISQIQGINVSEYDNYLSGQMLINCEKWRQDNIRERLTDFALDNSCLDEAPINIVLAGKIKELDKYWCIPASHVDDGIQHKEIKYKYDFSKGRIFHWPGANKPFHNKGVKNYAIYQKYI